jgi:hypothetical protein
LSPSPALLQFSFGRSFAAVIGSRPMSGQRPPVVGAPGAPRPSSSTAPPAVAQAGPRQPAPGVSS